MSDLVEKPKDWFSRVAAQSVLLMRYNNFSFYGNQNKYHLLIAKTPLIKIIGHGNGACKALQCNKLITSAFLV